jgi:hypothetical protein
MADIQPVCAGTFSRHRPFVRGSELVQRFHEIDHILPNTTRLSGAPKRSAGQPGLTTHMIRTSKSLC